MKLEIPVRISVRFITFLKPQISLGGLKRETEIIFQEFHDHPYQQRIGPTRKCDGHMNMGKDYAEQRTFTVGEINK